MVRCDNCPKEHSHACLDCFFLIDGGVLRKKLSSVKKIKLETLDGKSSYGDLFMLSPVGLGIKTNLDPSTFYFINLQESLKVKAKVIGSRGRDDFYGFDIIEVTRADGSSHRLNNEEYKALTISCDELIDEIADNLPENVRDIVQERLKTELEKAKILDSIKVGQSFKFQKGFVKPISPGAETPNLPLKELNAVANECSRKLSHHREIIIDEHDKMYDVHGIPFDYQSGGLLVLDVTHIIKHEREERKKEKRIYRDVVEAVTEGKFLLVDKEEASTFMSIGNKVLEECVNVPSDLDRVREKIGSILRGLRVHPKDILMYLVCVSEALTNTLKHAEGGTCTVNILNDGMTRIEIADHGPGINFKDIPKATLMKSFSTQKSLGCGFSIMLNFLDRLILASDPGGTVLILEKKKSLQGNNC